MSSEEPRRGCFGCLFRFTLYSIIIAVVLVVLLVAGVLVFTGAIHDRYVFLPQLEKDIQRYAQAVQPVALDDGWNDYRCVMHTHSLWSHDSRVPFERILEAGKNVGVDAFFMTDHCIEGHADFSKQWQGLHDGVLFVRGFEMSEGFLLWNMPEDTSILCMMQPEQIAQMAEEKGGLLFYAHSEEDRLWDLPQYKGMEIYNIHTDLKDEKLFVFLVRALFSRPAYPELAMRLLYNDHPAIMAHWDELNQKRKITGFAANDAHQNNGIRLVYNQDGDFELWEAGPKFVKKFPKPISSLLYMYFKPTERNTTVYDFVVDKYEYSINFDNTHVLAKELTQEALVDSLIQGRCYVAFNGIAPAKGFVYIARDGKQQATMGEELKFSKGVTLKADAPLPCRYTVVKDGKTVHTFEGKTLDWQPTEAGQYRLELHLMLAGTWTPWIYTNPITLR